LFAGIGIEINKLQASKIPAVKTLVSR